MATSQTIDVHQTDLGLSQSFAMANIHEKVKAYFEVDCVMNTARDLLTYWLWRHT